MSRPKKQPASISTNAPNINEPETFESITSMPSKKVIHLMLDAGRSSIKYQAFVNNPHSALQLEVHRNYS